MIGSTRSRTGSARDAGGGTVRGVVASALRPAQTGEDEAAPSVVGVRHGHRERTLTGTFGKTRIAVPRARLMGDDGKTREWRSGSLRAYQRRTRAADALIAGAYLSNRPDLFSPVGVSQHARDDQRRHWVVVMRCLTDGPPGVAYDAYAWPTPAPFLYSCCFCAASGSCATPLAVRWLPEQPSEQGR